MLTKIREKFDVPLNFLAGLLCKLRATPTTVSFVGLACAAASACFYFFSGEGEGMRMWALAFLVLSGLFDALDGALARLCGKATRFGGIVDSTFDRLGEIVIFAALTVGAVVPVYIGVLALSSSLMVSYVRSRAEAEGISMKGRGLAERPERLVILIGATLFNQLPAGLLLIGILASLTVMQRLAVVRTMCNREM